MSDRTFLERSWDAQHRIEKKLGSLGKGKYARVLRMARKPEPQEFRQTALVVLVGVMVVGGIGFAIFLLMSWLLGVVGAT